VQIGKFEDAAFACRRPFVYRGAKKIYAPLYFLRRAVIPIKDENFSRTQILHIAQTFSLPQIF